MNIPNFKSNMPAFGDILTEEEIIAVMTYLKSMWPEKERRAQFEAMSPAAPWTTSPWPAGSWMTSPRFRQGPSSARSAPTSPPDPRTHQRPS